MLRIYQQPSYSSHSSELDDVTGNGFSICVEYAFSGLPGKEDYRRPRPGYSNNSSLVPTVAFSD